MNYDEVDDFLDADEVPRVAARPAGRSSLLLAGLIGGSVLFCVAVGVAAAAFLVMTRRGAAPVPVAAKSAVEPPQPPAAAEADCEELGRRFADAVNSADSAAIAAEIDWNALFDRLSVGLDVPPAQRPGVIAGLRKGTETTGFTAALASQVGKGGTFTFLHTVERDGRPRAVCRMINEVGAVNFFELLPAAGPEPKAADIYAYTTGELISASFRRALVPILANQNRGFLERLSGTETGWVTHTDAIRQMSADVLAGRPKEVLDAYDKLPESLRREKALMINAIGAAADVDEARYLQLLEEYRKAFPRDPSLNLLLIDREILRKDYDAARRAILRLEEAVGGDDYLKTLRASVALLDGDHAEAERLVGEVIGGGWNLPLTHFVGIGAAAQAGDADRAVERIEILESVADVPPADIETSIGNYPGAAEFLASDAYKQWKARYESQGTE